MLLPNGYRTTALFLGTMLAGRVVAPFNLLAQQSQLAHCLGHSDCRIVFTTEAERARLDAALAALPPQRRQAVEVVAIDVDVPGADAAATAASLDIGAPLDADALRCSCTRRAPQACRRARCCATCNLVAAGRAVAGWHGLTRDDRCLSSLPLYHINGQCIATITPFVSGGSVVAPHRFSASAWSGLVERTARRGSTWCRRSSPI